eukprot:TRINITY_DN1787_c0_g1_i3.p1 TRINITY_DN1787_c0_g1~~TRINITY_DN1787_c0_g1_i3.p1  ORF type:complete len:134 (+),score=23.65 TRINITY_DN1787_c0_g1_i3:149-550(+)
MEDKAIAPSTRTDHFHGEFRGPSARTAEIEMLHDPKVRWRNTPDGHFFTMEFPPGFSGEDIKVRMDKHGNLSVRGDSMQEEMTHQADRPTLSRLHRFRKVFGVPQSERLNVQGMSAKFKNSVLTIFIPKHPSK